MNNNFSLNDGVAKKKSYFFAEISVLSCCKLKTIQVIIKSLVHAVATFIQTCTSNFKSIKLLV